MIHEFAEDNVKYLELRSTPKDIPSTGMTRDLYVRTMLRAVRDCQLEDMDIMVYILLSIDRRNSVEIAQLTVDLAEKFYKETGVVVGLDFSGHPGVSNDIFFTVNLYFETNFAYHYHHHHHCYGYQLHKHHGG